MSDEQTMPDDLVKVNTVGWDADAMQEHVFDCHQAIRTLTAEQDSYKVQREMADLRYTDAQATIATLTAERDALVAAIGVALPLLDRVPGDEYTLDEHDDIRIMKEMHLAAQLKEQDDE